MEKKPTKKAAVAKKPAAAKEIKLKKTAAAAVASPVKKTAARSVSEPGATATASAPKKTAKARAATAATSTVKKPVARKTAVATAEPKKAVKKSAKPIATDVTAELAATEPKVAVSPVFKALSEPVLPELTRENRARLLMQTPTRLYFYWAVRENPWHLLKKAFGSDTGSYTLVLKLTNTRSGYEELHPCDAAGNWWFDVEPNGEYEAEVGFYAPNRPYFRIIYSNTVETPRRSPSPRPASEAEWRVSANKFAEVLDVAGFSQDAFDVAIAGDDHAASTDATQTAFTAFAGEHDLGGISAEDIRYAMLAIASGAKLEDLRHRISPALFAILAANADKLFASKAAAALTEYFDIDETEFTEEQLGPAVYGASLVHFPKTFKTKRTGTISMPGETARRYAPLGSHSLIR